MASPTLESNGWGLKIQAEDLEPSVDIIAVQGLGASPEYTWIGRTPQAQRSKTFPLFNNPAAPPTEEVTRKVLWLRDLLPKYIPHARIATYSYPSQWLKSNWFANANSAPMIMTLREYGEQLLNELLTNRKAAGASNRPIIFIGHSLGGLVIKQALVLARFGKMYENIRMSTAGVVFLGTPHDGSDAAVFAETIAKILGNNAKILGSLKSQSSDLFGLSRDFDAEYQDLKTICYYEKVDASFVGGMVNMEIASKKSSTISTGQIMYLNTDHSGLNKFYGHEDPNFKIVCQGIQSMAKDAHEIVSKNINKTSTKEQKKACFIVPFERDSNFVPRREITDIIAHKFETHSRLALVGLGGVGKSQIAIEHCYRLKERSPDVQIFWAHASSTARLRQAYMEIANELDVPGRNESEIDILPLLTSWLGDVKNGRWFMVLDNADDEQLSQDAQQPEQSASLSKYIPQCSHGSILMTSRSRSAAYKLTNGAERLIDVSSMNENDATILLNKKLPGDNSSDKDTRDLVRALGYLPLAINQASAYIGRTAPSMTVSRYLSLFREKESNLASLMNRHGEDLRRDETARTTVMRTWQISFERIAKENPRSARILSVMSAIDWNEVPKSLFCTDDEDVLEVEDALGPLIDYSLIVPQGKGESYGVHRLVHLSTREWLKASGTFDQMAEEALDLVAKSFPGAELEAWKTCASLLPHVETVLKYSFTSPQCLLNRAKILSNMAPFLLAKGRYQAAYDRAKEALELKDELLAENDLGTLASAHILGKAARSIGKLKEAEEVSKRAMEGRILRLGEMNPNTLASADQLAMIYAAQGKYKEAEELELHALEGIREALGSETRITLAFTANLAQILYSKGDYRDSKELYIKVLTGYEKLFGPDHIFTLDIINNLAGVFKSLAEYEKAKELYSRALSGYQREHDDDHPSVLSVLNNMGMVSECQGDYAAAITFYSKAYEEKKRVLGSEHTSTVDTQCCMARMFDVQGQYDDALQWFERALEIKMKRLGSEHVSTLSTIHDIGAVRVHKGQYKDANILFDQALRGRERVLPPNHPDTLETLNNRASMFMKEGRFDYATLLFERVLAGKGEILGVNHPSTLNTMSDLACLFDEQGFYAKAAAQFEELLRREVRGPLHPATIDENHSMAGVFCHQGRYDEALELFEQVLTAKEKLEGMNSLWVFDTVDGMAEVLDCKGRYEDSMKAYTRALNGTEKLLGPDHPSTLLTVHNIGILLDHEGKSYEEAAKYFHRALKGSDGEDDPFTHANLHGLACVGVKQGKYGEATKNFERALQGRERIFGKAHPHTLSTVHGIAMNLSKQRKHDEAMVWYSRALDGREQILGENHPLTLETVDGMAEALHGTAKSKEALIWYDRALAGRSEALGNHHPATLDTLHNKASVLKAQGSSKEALDLYTQCLTGREKVLGESHPMSIQTMIRKAEALLSHGKPEEALKLFKRALVASQGDLGGDDIAAVAGGMADAAVMAESLPTKQPKQTKSRFSFF